MYCIFSLRRCFLSLQAAIYVCNKGGAWSDVRVSDWTGQKGRTDSSASGRSGEDDPGGVWTLPHEDNQLRGESQSRLYLHQLLGRALWLSPPSNPPQLWGPRGMDYPALWLGPPGGFSPAGKQVVSLIKRQNNGLKEDSPALGELRPAGIINREQTLFTPPPAKGQMDRASCLWCTLKTVLTLVHLAVMERNDSEQRCAEQELNSFFSLFSLSNLFSPNFVLPFYSIFRFFKKKKCLYSWRNQLCLQ